MASYSRLYVTLFGNFSWDIYENNTNADFMVKLLRPIDLQKSSNWDVCECEISYSSPLLEAINALDITPCSVHVLIYCNLISPLYVRDSTVLCYRTFPTSSCRQHEFLKRAIRFGFHTFEGLQFPFEDSATPINVVLHFRKNYSGDLPLLYNISSASAVTHS